MQTKRMYLLGSCSAYLGSTFTFMWQLKSFLDDTPKYGNELSLYYILLLLFETWFIENL